MKCKMYNVKFKLNAMLLQSKVKLKNESNAGSSMVIILHFTF